jgi:hypothetical protein
MRGLSCSRGPDDFGTYRGYPCFRPGSLPIVIMFGDYSFHNDKMGNDPYTSIPAAPTYAMALDALRGIGARFIGVFSGGTPAFRADYEDVARDTGSVRPDGTPLVFDIMSDGTGLSRTVVDAVATLVGGVPQDVGTRTENVPGNPDDFDARLFIKAIVPFEGYGPMGEVGPMPGVTYERKDDRSFYQVIPGTQVEFTVDFWNDVRMTRVTEIHKAKIVVVGNGVADLDERNVYIVVPPDGGVVLI